METATQEQEVAEVESVDPEVKSLMEALPVSDPFDEQPAPKEEHTGDAPGDPQKPAEETTTETEQPKKEDGTGETAKEQPADTQKPKDQKPPEPKTDDEPKTAHDKEWQRRFKSWKEFDAEKKAEREKIAAEKQSIAEHRRELEAYELELTKPRATVEQAEAAAKQLADKAKQLEADGEMDKAAIAKHQAEELQQYSVELLKNPPKGWSKEEVSKRRAMEIGRSWEGVKAVAPEFLKGGAFNQSMIDFAQKNQGVLETADGPWRAAVSVLKSAASRVPDLEKTVAELKSENERLTKLTSMGQPGVPQGQPKAVPFESLPVDAMWKAVGA